MTETRTRYFRRVTGSSPWWRGKRGRRQYEVWVPDGQPIVVSVGRLDKMLDGRRFPADFWAAVTEADRAFETGNWAVWIESGTGRLVTEPPGELNQLLPGANRESQAVILACRNNTFTPELLGEAFGPYEGADLVAYLQGIMDELDELAPDWQSESLNEAMDRAITAVTKRHPELDDQALRMLKSLYGFGWK